MVLVSEESLDVLRSWAQGSEVPFPVLSDPTGAAFRPYQADALPRTVLINREGGVAAILPGYSDEAFHRQFVPAVEKALGIGKAAKHHHGEGDSLPQMGHG